MKNKTRVFTGIAGIVIAMVLMTGVVFAQDEAPVGTPVETPAETPLTEATEPAPPAEPAASQEVLLSDPAADPTIAWTNDSLSTAGLKFLIRGKEALAWTLNINENGFDNPAISSSFLKVLTIVNSLFIIGLLAIALLWMFSLVVPRSYLRQVILIYGFAVIFVNFSMPLNRLLIDSANLVQKTFLTGEQGMIGIVDIAKTPEYQTADLYRNPAGETKTPQEQSFALQLPLGDTPIGKVQPGPDKTLRLSGTQTGSNNGVIELSGIQTGGDVLSLQTAQPLSATLVTEKTYNPNQEQSAFVFALLLFTGLAYFSLALVFVVRIVILWTLLILSPLLFLVAIFKTTRGYFYNWLSLYGRWLLIGPLAALGLSVVVNIWKVVGLPIHSTYPDLGTFGTPLNISFLLPGRTTPNDLSTTGDMMEYLLFLIMLYLPVVFAFALTRSKSWNTLGQQLLAVPAVRSVRELVQPAATPASPSAPAAAAVSPLVGQVKDFFASKFSRSRSAEFVGDRKNTPSVPLSQAPSASRFLPDQLALSTPQELMGLVGARPESRASREHAISALARPEMISDVQERKHVTSVRQEIERRATSGDSESRVILNEISRHTSNVQNVTSTVAGPPTPLMPPAPPTPGPTIAPEKNPPDKPEPLKTEPLKTEPLKTVEPEAPKKEKP